MTIKRKTVRDGVIRAETVHVALHTGDVSENIAAAMQLSAFGGPARIIAAYRKHAEAVRDEVPKGSRHKYACDAIWQADEAAKYLGKGDAASAVQHAIWMMACVWRMDVKGVEPEIVKGVNYSKTQSRKGKISAANLHAGKQATSDIIKQLAKRTDVLGDPLPPAELWSEFFGALDEDGLGPIEVKAGKLVQFGECQSMAFDAFRRAIQRHR